MPKYQPQRTAERVLSLSRREFVRQTLAVAGLGLMPGLGRGDDNTDERPKLRSHHPKQILKDPETFIQNVCMPRPKGQKLAEQIFKSSRLENVFLIDFGKQAVLLDTGFDHQVHHHLDNLEALGCDLSKVVAILASHSHVDHTGGLKQARERLGVPVVAHPRAVGPIGSGDLLQTAAVIPEVRGWTFEFPACPIDETVDHGDVIQIGDARIEVIHIPGHTPDSLGYLWNGHFFTGDTVFGGGGVGWADERWFSNYSDHAETMLHLIRSKLTAQTFYCTHGPALPWNSQVPEACLTTLRPLIAQTDDPCNATPRTKRRSDEEPTRVLELPAA